MKARRTKGYPSTTRNNERMKQSVIYTHDTRNALRALIAEAQPDRTFVLTDEITHRLCLPLLQEGGAEQAAREIVIGATDTHKTLDTLAYVWTNLCEGGASRKSLLVNLGGGMVTDLGGFAASTFKRGMRFVNVPTTLLAMVDAAVGGKTGINFNGLKNEIGSFSESRAVVIDTQFLRTLDRGNLLSGYAEMLKHALLENREMWATHLQFEVAAPDYALLQQLVEQSVCTKQRIVEADPHERGMRKALNLGHTVGHAFESFAMERRTPVLHGYAVAWGLLCELYMSSVHAGFPVTAMRQTVDFIRTHYGQFAFTCDDYAHLYDLMKHDKKNADGVINFTLLGNIGDIRLNQHVERQTVYDAFDFMREG